MSFVTSILFLLANIDRIFKEENDMDKNIIIVKPDKNGKLFITLYGTKYEIVVEKEKPATETKESK